MARRATPRLHPRAGASARASLVRRRLLSRLAADTRQTAAPVHYERTELPPRTLHLQRRRPDPGHLPDRRHHAARLLRRLLRSDQTVHRRRHRRAHRLAHLPQPPQGRVRAGTWPGSLTNDIGTPPPRGEATALRTARGQARITADRHGTALPTMPRVGRALRDASLPVSRVLIWDAAQPARHPGDQSSMNQSTRS